MERGYRRAKAKGGEVSMDEVAGVVGKTRQGYYKHRKLAQSHGYCFNACKRVPGRPTADGRQEAASSSAGRGVKIGRDLLFDLLRIPGMDTGPIPI
jgi:hypothetical protein